jgi:hypothetical protein
VNEVVLFTFDEFNVDFLWNFLGFLNVEKILSGKPKFYVSLRGSTSVESV